jgi:hypothetical protein
MRQGKRRPCAWDSGELEGPTRDPLNLRLVLIRLSLLHTGPCEKEPSQAPLGGRRKVEGEER